MTLESVVPILSASGVFSALAIKAPELLKEIYNDLAKPGVAQVGVALKNVLLLGNNALLPIRLLNETARLYEQRKFKDIAERFSSIPLEEVVETSPELGSPILEKLSYTSDRVLRTMFIELLAKASTASQVRAAHPSFVNIIASLSPDEAILMKSFETMRNIPMISMEAVSQKDQSSTTLSDFIIVPPDGLVFPDRIPLYLSNLSGLGLVETRRNSWLTATGAYNEVEEFGRLRCNFPPTFKIEDEDRPIEIKKHVVIVQPYGISFVGACS